jgi:hypothetical protein
VQRKKHPATMMDKRRQSDHGLAAPKEADDKNRRRTLHGGESLTLQEPQAAPLLSLTPSKQHAKLHLGTAAVSYYFSGTPKAHKKQKDVTGEISIGFGDTSMISLGGASSSSEESDMLNKSVLSDTTELTASNFILAAASRQLLKDAKSTPWNKPARTVQDQENHAPVGIIREPLKRVNPSPETHISQTDRLRDLTNSLRKNRLKEDEESRSRLSLGSATSAVAKSDSVDGALSTPASLDRISPAPPKYSSTMSVHSSGLTASDNTSDVSATSLDDLFAGLLEGNENPRDADTSIDSPLLTPRSVSDSVSAASIESSPIQKEHVSEIASYESPLKMTPESPSRLTPSKLSSSPARAVPGYEAQEQDNYLSPVSANAGELAHFRLEPHLHQTRLTPTKIAPSPRRVLNPDIATAPARNTRSKSPQKLSIEEIIAASNHGAKSRMSDISLMSAIDPRKKGRFSDVTANTQDFQALLSAESPATNASFQKIAPKSILNSSKKRKAVGRDSLTSRKSVAFGSPDAAEYRIGSPSVNLTPMPHKQAKAMYAIPRDTSPDSPLNEDSSPEHSNSEDQTVEMDIDMNALIGAMDGQDVELTQGSGEAENVEPTLSAENTDPSQETATLIGSDQTESSIDSEMPGEEEDQTIELEATIQGLLHNTFKSDASRHENSSSPADSMDIAGAQSIFSANSQISKRSQDTATSPQLDQNIDDSSQMSEFAERMATEDEDNTVELEGDLGALLAAASQGSDDLDSSDELRSVKLTDKFPKMQSSIAPSTNRLSFGNSHIRSQDDIDEMTTELESTMDSVVNAVNSSLMDEDATETVELESTMNSLLEAAESTVEDTEEQMTRSIALESNMDSLLNAAEMQSDQMHEFDTSEMVSVISKEEVFHFDLSDTPKTSGDPRRRSSSASSRRFSLAPSSQVSLSKDGSVMHIVDSQEVAFLSNVPTSTDQEIDLTTDEDDPEEEVLDLTSAQIDEIAGLRALTMNHEVDSVVEARSMSDIAKNKFITEALEGFIEAVCSEVEGKAEVSSDSDTCFQSLVEEMPDQLLQLQKGLHQEGGKEGLRSLAVAVQKFVENEWTTWETMVAEALVGQVNQIPGEIEDDEGRISKCSTLVDDTQESLSLMAGRAAQKARRRSMDRRITAVSIVDHQIKELETELEDARRGLETMSLQLEAINDAVSREEEAESVKRELALCRKVSETSQNKCISLKGLSSSSVLKMDDTELSVAFVGTSPKSCFTVSFDLKQNGPITCTAVASPAHFSMRRGRRKLYTPSTVNFIKARVSTMIESVSKNALSSISEIGMLLQRLEWTKGRVEHTANELTSLQRRYKADVTTDPDGRSKSDFLVQVVFSCSKDKLFATFELTAAYPFGTLNVSLDSESGQLDVDGLRKQLIQNAKPGFGYMSRACDVMSAFVG